MNTVNGADGSGVHLDLYTTLFHAAELLPQNYPHLLPLNKPAPTLWNSRHLHFSNAELGYIQQPDTDVDN